MMSCKLVRAALPALLAVTVLATPAAAASPAAPVPAAVTVLDYNSTGWRYLQVASNTTTPTFQDPKFDDSEWPTGQAAFGTSTGCAFNASVKTSWQPNTDILVRHWLHIPAGARDVRIQGTIDNDAQIYLNGRLLQTVRSGYCRADNIDVRVPADALSCTCDLLAIRGHDYGGSTFLDVRVTYTRPDRP
ncbi:hypothetical protein [Sphaerisporangium fuscum]|uniref:hypothetical protein n=1 Tax=Sphaerisporangium fuscum TaxID=2835868 RepID=UPI001BDC78D9|nr:hypothetical protein [Sphaerisporangium fuscum]